MLNLEKTPYLLEPQAEIAVTKKIKKLEERVELLRSAGTLTDRTLLDYYGEKRFEQIAESNAIEGSTLSVGETELAVLKGITITGHDPAYVRDARSLSKALDRMTDMARESKQPTDIEQLLELHLLILGDRAGAGTFRNEPVRIKGSAHKPPMYWREIMNKMEEWESWSRDNADSPAILRSIILHAWLAHIHPFIDGNGRTARAITNLELIRAGYPPVIIRKKKDRDRYVEALAESDEAGDIRAFFELMIERIEGALQGLELSAKQKQEYNPRQLKIRNRQEQQLHIWSTSVQLLVNQIEYYVHEQIDKVNGVVYVKEYDLSLDREDFIALCDRQTISTSWLFIIGLKIPGFSRQERLAYLGYRNPSMYHKLGDEGGPSIFWSRKNDGGYPKWIHTEDEFPFAVEITTKLGQGDEWYGRTIDGSIVHLNTTAMAKRIANSLVEMLTSSE